MQRPFPNGHKCPFGCDGYVTAVTAGKSQRFYSGVGIFSWYYFSSPIQIPLCPGVPLESGCFICKTRRCTTPRGPVLKQGGLTYFHDHARHPPFSVANTGFDARRAVAIGAAAATAFFGYIVPRAYDTYPVAPTTITPCFKKQRQRHQSGPKHDFFTTTADLFSVIGRARRYRYLCVAD